MTVTARDIARARWQLDNEVMTIPCGCRFLLGPTRLVERRVYECKKHRPQRLPAARPE